MLITVTLEGALSTLLLTDLHRQNVSVCFFSEQKCTYTLKWFKLEP
jgi:hypothetical protein